MVGSNIFNILLVLGISSIVSAVSFSSLGYTFVGTAVLCWVGVVVDIILVVGFWFRQKWRCCTRITPSVPQAYRIYKWLTGLVYVVLIGEGIIFIYVLVIPTSYAVWLPLIVVPISLDVAFVVSFFSARYYIHDVTGGYCPWLHNETVTNI